MTAVTVGAFTWPSLASVSTAPLDVIQICWYSSLIFSITAVGMALHQSVFLLRVMSVTKSNTIPFNVLTYETGYGERSPRKQQAFIWVLAMGLLEFSMYFWLGGFIVFLWDVTKMGRGEQRKGDIMV
jgi:hypothetical protein